MPDAQAAVDAASKVGSINIGYLFENPANAHLALRQTSQRP